jgi:hypothetical protein
VKSRASLADQWFEKIVSQTKQLRGRFYSERVESKLAKFGRMVDFYSLLKFSMGLNLGWERFGEFGELAVREDRVADKTATWPYFIRTCRIETDRNLLLVDFRQPVEVFNGTDSRLGIVGRVWRTCCTRRSCRRRDSYVAVYFPERVQ